MRVLQKGKYLDNTDLNGKNKQGYMADGIGISFDLSARSNGMTVGNP
jgi:hypothetical protein